MGRLIFAVLLVTILTISRASNNPTPVPASHCLSSLLHAVAAAYCLATVSKVESTRAVLPLNCSKLTVTEVRC